MNWFSITRVGSIYEEEISDSVPSQYRHRHMSLGKILYGLSKSTYVDRPWESGPAPDRVPQ